MTPLVQGRFVEGPRSAEIRCGLPFHPVNDFSALKDRAHELEQCEQVATGQGVIGPDHGLLHAGLAIHPARNRNWRPMQAQSQWRTQYVVSAHSAENSEKQRIDCYALVSGVYCCTFVVYSISETVRPCGEHVSTCHVHHINTYICTPTAIETATRGMSVSLWLMSLRLPNSN
jgi:hypothetical protein